MKYTDNLKLDLVEGTDNANLMDFYNHSMRLIDQAYTRLTVDYETIVKQSSDTSNLVAQIEATVAALRTAVDSLATQVAALNSSVAATGKKVQTNTDNIAELDARVKVLEAK
ncbi:hypothetical protein [uncultured Bifidobacterium sp.]|mgnify:FL=1|uniref:hypothetical protein n=1 Tax=uncultured Bifidobacterium sp. TaxID=165187 RepID=UPI0025992810|nr:hypothetical protein [uncultured Bifidobacterium sp.]